MTKRMLIDASHREETRVVVINDHQLEEFDFESASKKQLKGNIYLAKVTRVEPSLQAAFVDYGGQRHGFLAFSEIHPDYYQIPQADRKLLEETAEAEEEESAGENGAGAALNGGEDEDTAEDYDEQARRRSRLLRSYKIQEVIKRRQILLVQVVKEERGNKGAALTTYLSLPGRYSVLMPNTARGGGISRKIANAADRARLKAIARELNVPEGMGLIIRTAGQQRNKAEIRRDYEYSLRLWDDIRERTLQSIAPCLIYEEGDLVKRAIRDLYTRDIDEVLVEGEEGYRTARKMMAMLMPSRARRVKLYKGDVPLFHHFDVEEQLDALHHPKVDLKSGGSIVIHTTEALTAIDVNSGRSTRERNIEETALKTNLEAAQEIARQLRLRDIAGLVVIDFIDMNDPRNQKAVERKLREHLKADRARIQLGRISLFGLLELSRQRLRPSFQELSTAPCPACHGAGMIRSVESAALQALRAIEMEGIKGAAAALAVTLPDAVALYLLNEKRSRLVDLEARYDMHVDVRVDPDLVPGSLRLETTQPKAAAEEAEAEAEAPAEAAAEATAADEGEAGRKRRRRRRRRRKPSEEEAEVGAGEAAPETPAEPAPEPAPEAEPVQPLAAETPEQATPVAAETEQPARRPRRRRRRTSRTEAEPAVAAVTTAEQPAPMAEAPLPVVQPAPEPPAPAATPNGEQEPIVAESRVARASKPEASQTSAEAGMAPAAVVEQQGGAPRRGWWSRFVRKEE